MTHLVILRETTLARLLWLAYSGKRPGVLDVRPLMPPLLGPMERLSRWLRARELAFDVARDRPDLLPAADRQQLRRACDPFAAAEPWMNRYYRFEEIDGVLGDYARPYKHVICNGFLQRTFLAHTVKHLADRGEEFIISGLDRDVLDLYRHFFDAPPPERVHASVSLRPLVNGLLGLLAAAFSAFWIVSRIRPFRPEPIFLGFDAVGPAHHDREEVFWRETSDGAPGPVVLFYRSARYLDRLRHLATEWPRYAITDGRFRFLQGVAATARTLKDCWMIYRRLYWLPSDYFWNMAKMPKARFTYRALFTRFPCNYFWGRDDYNAEHIIRGQELRRVGGTSIGLLHGLPSTPPVICELRYIDYDVYYVFGRDFHRFYRDTWPEAMTVKATGAWSLTREELVRLGHTRPRDIIYFSSPSLQDMTVINTLVQIAQAFPDRTVYFRPKRHEMVDEVDAGLDRLAGGRPGNIRVTHEWSYDLIFKASYVLSDPSTLVVECIQFGMPTFAAKFIPEWKNLYFDEFPGLCVESVEEFIERIKALEAGTYTYRRDDYAGLVNLSGDVIWDIIRTDMGLPPKGAAPDAAPAETAGGTPTAERLMAASKG